MRIAISGGHFSPALSLISQIIDKEDIVLIGRKHALDGDSAFSFEYLVCKQLKIPFFDIPSARFQRSLSLYSFASIINFPLGIIAALKILKNFKPDVVVTFGGYVSLPIAISSLVLNIPVVIHEQSLKAGLANKIISYFAKKVCISFPSSRRYFPKDKVILTGNPIRKEIFEVIEKIDLSLNLPIIYITGGSTGSHFINSLVSESLKELLLSYSIIHQTGNSDKYKDFKKAEEAKEMLSQNLQKRYILKQFFSAQELGWVLSNCDLVVSRAGMNTVCEILARGKICFLIPLPHGQSGEQIDNARLIKEIGIGDYMLEQYVTKKAFIDKITSMIKNKDEYLRNVKAAQKLYVSNATQKIINVIRLVHEEKRKKE